MTTTTLHKELRIDSIKNNIVTGQLLLQSPTAISLGNVYAFVILEARGRMSSFKDEVTSFELANNITIPPNEEYKIPFSFDTADYTVDSYVGKNVSFAYKLEVHIVTKNSAPKKVDKSLFSKVKSFITTQDDGMKISADLTLNNPNQQYQAVETTADFTIQPNYVIVLFVIALLGGIYAYIMPPFEELHLVIGIGLIGILTYLTPHLIASIIGKLGIKIRKDENGFIGELVKPRKLKLTQPKVYYQVIEKVIDKRGTSSSSYTKTIFTSESQKISNYKSIPSLHFSFPSIGGIHSLEYKDISINWQMTLVGKYMGLKLTYECEFKVEKKKPIVL